MKSLMQIQFEEWMAKRFPRVVIDCSPFARALREAWQASRQEANVQMPGVYMNNSAGLYADEAQEALETYGITSKEPIE